MSPEACITMKQDISEATASVQGLCKLEINDKVQILGAMFLVIVNILFQKSKDPV